MKSYCSLNSIKDAIKADETNCLSLTKRYIQQIEKNKHLNAFVEVFEDEAIARAKEITPTIIHILIKDFRCAELLFSLEMVFQYFLHQIFDEVF